MSARVIRVVLEYDGTGFAGWQIQPDMRTVQKEVEEALERLTGSGCRVHAAGRTDAGVHALGQVVSFTTESRLEVDRFVPGLNRFLPADIVAKKADEAPPGFHARYSAVSKTYEYRCVVCRGRRPLAGRTAWEVWPPPDVAAMSLAARELLGTHDFAAFAASGRMPGPTVRTMRRALVEEIETGGDPGLSLTFTADGFLYKMVRNIVGTLIEVGQGKRTVEAVRDALLLGRRELSGPTAPAKGLTLIGVDYEPPA